MNKWLGIGRITKELEIKYTSNNKAVCSFTIAVNNPFAQGKADFIPVVAWEKKAEFASKYFCKGLQIGVEGRLSQRTWEDTEGKKHTVLEIIASELYFADGKRENPESIPGITISDADDSESSLPF